ncbi:MAG: hypothetical protein P4L46_05920 [Fimbriimonas sp.]|nr:hypothetical protein [Fimbriimonas sp.]
MTLTILLIAAASASATSKAQAPGGIVVSPVMIRTAVQPRHDYTLAIDLSNLGASPMNVLVKLHSVVYSDWTYIAKPDAKNERDCSHWFRQTEITKQLRGSSEATFDLNLHVPSVRSGCYYCIASVSPKSPARNDVIATAYDVPIILLVGRQEKPEIRLGTPFVDGPPDDPVIRVPFENRGDGFTVVGSDVRLLNSATGRQVGQFSDRDRNLYPHSKRYLTFSAPALGPGVYSVRSHGEAGIRRFSDIAASLRVTKKSIVMAKPGETFKLAPVTLDPGLVSVRLTPGASRFVVLHVTNSSDQSLVLGLRSGSLSQTRSGAFEVSPTGISQVRLDPDRLTIPSKRIASIVVKVTAPQDARGDLWYGVSVDASNLTNSIPEDVYIRATLKGGAPRLELDRPTFDFDRGIPVGMHYVVRNTGTLALRPIPSGSVLARGLDLVGQIQIPPAGDGGVLPGSEIDGFVQLPASLKPGSYTVQIQYQYGESLFARLNAPFEVPQPQAQRPRRHP